MQPAVAVTEVYYGAEEEKKYFLYLEEKACT